MNLTPSCQERKFCLDSSCSTNIDYCLRFLNCVFITFQKMTRHNNFGLFHGDAHCTVLTLHMYPQPITSTTKLLILNKIMHT